MIAQRDREYALQLGTLLATYCRGNHHLANGVWAAANTYCNVVRAVDPSFVEDTFLTTMRSQRDVTLTRLRIPNLYDDEEMDA